MIVITMLSSVVIKLQHVFNFCLVHSQSVHILNFVIRERERERDDMGWCAWKSFLPWAWVKLRF